MAAESFLELGGSSGWLEGGGRKLSGVGRMQRVAGGWLQKAFWSWEDAEHLPNITAFLPPTSEFALQTVARELL